MIPEAGTWKVKANGAFGDIGVMVPGVSGVTLCAGVTGVAGVFAATGLANTGVVVIVVDSVV